MAAELENNELIKQEQWLQTFEEEITSVQEQINLSTKRNVVESYVSLNNKVFLCGRHDYMLKLMVGCMEKFVTKRKIELKRDFDREDYPGATDLKAKLAETELMRRMNRKLQLIQEFVTINRAVFDRYEADLHVEQYAIVAGTMDAIQSYLVELRVLHTAADNLLATYLKLQKRAKISRDAIQLLDGFNQEKHNELGRSGRVPEIKELPVTRIELFKDGEIHWVKVKCKDQGQNRGWLATLESSKINISQNLID